MKYKRADRLIQEIDILNNRTISVDYLVNVFNVRRQSILNDLYILRDRGYNVVKIEIGTYTIKELTTKELVEQVKALNMASDRKCVKCVCYVAEYRDQNEVRPACSNCGNYGYVSHNPARLCRYYKTRKSVAEEKLKRLKKEYNILNMQRKSAHRGLMAHIYNEQRKRVREQIKELEGETKCQ